MPSSQPIRRNSISVLMFALAAFALLLTGSALAEPDPGETLRGAAQGGDLERVRALLEAGTPVDAANSYGATALGYAADKGYLEIVRLLIQRGADVNVEDTFYHATPVVWASYNGHTAVVRLLLESGANGFEQALDIALSQDSLSLVDAVLAAEPAPEKLSKALAKARQKEGAEEIVARLEAAGAQIADTPAVEVPVEILERYTGTYSMVEGALLVEIALHDGALIAEFTGQDPLRLAPQDTQSFRPLDGPPILLRMSQDQPRSSGFELLSDDGTQRTFVRKEESSETQPAKETPEEAGAASTGADGSQKAEAGPASSDPVAAAMPKGAWPAFRGANAVGVASGHTLPTSWSSPDGAGVRWRLEVPGRAHSSPIIWGDRLYLTTAVSENGSGEFRHGLYGDVDSAGNDAVHSWRLYAVDRHTGDIEWFREARRGKPRADNHIKATQANATPTTDGEHIVAILGSEGLFAWNRRGELLWQMDLGLLDTGWFYDPSYQWGHSSSPILFDNRVIVQVDRSSGSYLAAFDVATGHQLWRTERENLPSWGTPTLLRSGEVTELVTNGSHLIRGYDPSTGKELWSLGPTSEVTVGTPVIGHGLAFVTGGYPPVRPIYAVRPGGRGDLTLGESRESSEFVTWSKGRGGTYMPTPLVYGNHLYTLANNGIFTCYDARSGEQVYRERIKARGGTAFSASPVAGDGKIFLASEDGDVYVVKAGSSFEVLATNAMPEVIMATPAIAEGTLYIRSLSHLYAVASPPSDGGETVAAPTVGGS